MGIVHTGAQESTFDLTEELILQAISSGRLVNLEELYDLLGYAPLVNLIERYGGDHLYMQEGKVTPFQRSGAFKSALENYDSFNEWYSKAIPVIPMGEMFPDSPLDRGSRAGMKDTASLMGLTDDDIRKYGNSGLSD